MRFADLPQMCWACKQTDEYLTSAPLVPIRNRLGTFKASALEKLSHLLRAETGRLTDIIELWRAYPRNTTIDRVAAIFFFALKTSSDNDNVIVDVVTVSLTERAHSRL